MLLPIIQIPRNNELSTSQMLLSFRISWRGYASIFGGFCTEFLIQQIWGGAQDHGISNKFSGDTDAANIETTLCEPLIKVIH